MSQKITAILIEHEADNFTDLVQEYAAMGYSEFATARRLLGIDVRTMHAYLQRPVGFKRYSSKWQDYAETAAAIVDARKRNGTLRMITHQGETLHLKEWSRRTGIPATTITRRIDAYGWPVERALTVGDARQGANRPHRNKPTKAQGIDFRNPTNGHAN